MISRKKAENRVRSFKFCQHITEVLSYYIKKKYSSIPQSPKTTKSKLRHSEIHSWSQKLQASPVKPSEHWHSQQSICQSHLGSVFFFSSANVQTDFPKFMRFNICYNRLQRKKKEPKKSFCDGNLLSTGLWTRTMRKAQRNLPGTGWRLPDVRGWKQFPLSYPMTPTTSGRLGSR